MPWLLQAAVPVSRQCSAPGVGCAAGLHICCPEALMAFGTIREGLSFTARFLPPAAPGLCHSVLNTRADGRAGEDRAT